VTRPIVFLTDYGLADEFVGICHGVMVSIAPASPVIDLTHAIPRQDVMRAALTLARAEPYMPRDAVWVAVVDPGVGSERREIALRTGAGALLVGPDNGSLSLLWERLGGVEQAVRIDAAEVLLQPMSRTFHGRDIFAPAGAHLAAGMPLDRVGSIVAADSLERLEVPGPMIANGAVGARVSGVDGFGNVQLNVRLTDLESAGVVTPLRVSGRDVPVAGVFADVGEGMLAAIVDSQGFVALVVNRGSASALLDLGPGDAVVLE